uniref:Uncharacterized protein n=1 Tax=Physcomitrium patens TaxID=3218 RepID=A0A2K1KU55_PHYPA|nr:hypothetical protein PHYPA_004311 [Physcomitrium patens]
MGVVEVPTSLFVTAEKGCYVGSGTKSLIGEILQQHVFIAILTHFNTVKV